MTDLPMLERSDLIRIASTIWPIFAETNRGGAVDLVRRVLRGSPGHVTPSEVDRIRSLAALAISRAPASRRIRVAEPREVTP